MPKHNQLSQNFLVDKNFILKEVEHAELSQGDTVLEIGTGPGNLTGELLKHCSVIGIEYDPALAAQCTTKFKSTEFKNTFTMLQGDALRLEFPKFTKVVSNIPYHISAPLIFKILEHDFELAVIICQKEFADKMAAQPGERNYGRLSVSSQARAGVELLDVVPRGAFRPAPEVDSRIVRLKPKQADLPKLFNQTVRALFQHRQQSVKNALTHSSHEIGFTPKIPLPDKKVFELTLPEITKLAEELEKEWEKKELNEKETGGASTQSST